MKLKRPLVAFLIGFWLTTLVSSQNADFYPIDLIKPGQKGFGQTIFEGVKVERFDVEILGVLENFGPKQNMILARLSGGQVERTGVFAGMSGSPVYVDDRLVGAVAFAFPFSTEALAGITPIGEMVNIFRERPPRVRSSATTFDPLALYQSQDAKPGDVLEDLLKYPGTSVGAEGYESASGRIRPIATPLSLSGFSPAALKPFAPVFESLGLVPVRGISSTSPTEYDVEPLGPGSTVTVQLVRGDMDISASGTVTHVSGDKVYAFGHPFLSLGTTDMPMNQGAVIAVIPSLQNSQKITATQNFIGTIRQDRATGIYGIRDAQPKMLPIRLKLNTSRNAVNEYNYEVVLDRLLTPFMINLTVNNVIVSSERSLGGQTLQVKCDIKVKDQPSVVFESSISEMLSTPALAAITLSAPVGLLLNSGFEDLAVERVEFEVTAVEETRDLRLMKVWQDKVEARPGEDVNLTVFLRKGNGETVVEKHPVRIPEGIRPGLLKIAIGDGLSLSRSESKEGGLSFVPENSGQLIKAINNLKKNNRLYIRLYRERSGAVIGGKGMPGLPPSVLALYKSRKTAGDVQSINKVVYFEYELAPKNEVLSGHKIVEVLVKS